MQFNLLVKCPPKHPSHSYFYKDEYPGIRPHKFCIAKYLLGFGIP
uniref:Uncharacterized protein n=1 Tax=Anguilla anguilla TaxID=7936 RepID=A0A0E9RGB0_ANGAN